MWLRLVFGVLNVCEDSSLRRRLGVGRRDGRHGQVLAAQWRRSLHIQPYVSLHHHLDPDCPALEATDSLFRLAFVTYAHCIVLFSLFTVAISLFCCLPEPYTSPGAVA